MRLLLCYPTSDATASKALGKLPSTKDPIFCSWALRMMRVDIVFFRAEEPGSLARKATMTCLVGFPLVLYHFRGMETGLDRRSNQYHVDFRECNSLLRFQLLLVSVLLVCCQTDLAISIYWTAICSPTNRKQFAVTLVNLSHEEYLS